MGSEVEKLEESLTSMLGLLQVECGILERMVYKNKNQHRRCSYFQYLLKRRKCNSGKHNFMERLLGASRLLSQMVEPMLMAATEISILLARSFFMGFSLTILGLLARLRVLVQQILLDVVSVFNMVSYLSQKKQYIKINQEGIEEFYPTNEEFFTLECVWKSDKFILLERMHKSKTGSDQEGDLNEEVSLRALTVKYQSIESFLGDDELVPDSGDADQMAEKGPSHIKDDKTLLADPSMEIGNGKAVEGCTEVGDGFVDATTIPSKKLLQEGGLLADSKLSNSLKINSGSRKVAFVSVKNPPALMADVKNPPLPATTNGGVKEDPFFSLLTGGNVNNSLF